jgi:acetyl-CoA synthetase
LSGSLSSDLNACIERCDRWVSGDMVALRYVARDLTRQDITFAQLQSEAARFRQSPA